MIDVTKLTNTTPLSSADTLKIWMHRHGLDYQTACDKWGFSEWQLRKMLRGEVEGPFAPLTFGDLSDAETALALRLELGFTQAQVASLLGMSKLGVWLMENGEVDRWGWSPDPGEVTLALALYLQFESTQV